MEAPMGTVRVTRLLALALFSGWAALGVSRAEGEKVPAPAPQTSPAEKKAPASKSKPKVKESPGIHTVKGRIVGVRESPPSVVVQTAVAQIVVFIAASTELTRDGEKTEIGKILPGDHVDACRYNAKHACLQLTLTSMEKLKAAPPAQP
jgi:hypothetical protein